MMSAVRHIIATLILFNTAILFAADETIAVRPAGDEFIETEPKSTNTTTIRITNYTSSSQEFNAQVELPQGWKLITKELPFRMMADESEIRILGFYVPQTTQSGTYEIKYHVISREFPSIHDYCSITVHVLPVRRLDLQVIDTPKNVIAGNDYQVTYLLVNRSNIADSVVFNVMSSPDLPLSISVPGVRLMPGESKELSMTVHIHEKIDYSFTHKVNLYAQFIGREKTAVNISNGVEVIPIKLSQKDPYHRFPIKASLRHVTQNNGSTQSGTQVDIYGDGTLDEEGEKKVKFRLRAPDIYDTSVLGEHDEIFIQYENDRYLIHVGDHFYGLSPLTEFSRYGRGIMLRYNYKQYRIGTYYQKTRWMLPQENQVAAYIKFPCKNNYDFQLNLLRKWGEETNGNILSGVVRTVPYQNAELEVEAAASEQKGNVDKGLWIKWDGGHQRYNYHINVVHAGKNFPGYYKNRDMISGAFSLSLIDNLRLDLNVRQYEDRFELRENYASVLNRYAYFSLRYRLGKRGPVLRLGMGEQSREDLQPDPRFNYNERTARFEFAQYWRILNFNLKAELGKTDNKLLDCTADMQRYIFSMRFKPISRMTLRGYLYYDNNQRYDRVEEEQFTYGVNSDIYIAKATEFAFNYRSNYSKDYYYTDRNVFDVSLKHTFRNKHQFVAKARRTLLKNTLDLEDMAVMVQYHVPIGIKMGRKKNMGIVYGYIHDSATDEPIQNVIVRINNDVTITDTEGYFLFPSLSPKIYYLRIDKENLGFNCVTEQRTPIAVEVKGGFETQINLTITKSASLHGLVMVYTIVNDSSDHFSADKMKYHLDDYYIAGNGKKHGNHNGQKNGNGKDNVNGVVNGKTKLVEDYALANIIIEMMKDDGEIQRRITDHEGRFYFDDLRPGKWIVKAYDQNLPINYLLKSTSFEIDIKPNDKKEVQFMVVPEKRRIQFIQEGGTVKEQPQPKPKPKP